MMHVSFSEVKRLRRANNRTGERLSFAEIGKALAAKGFLNENGQPYNPKSARAMIGQG